MSKLESTARELVRELPKIIGKTGESRIDYQVSDLITVLATDLRSGQIRRGESILAKLDALQGSLGDWGGAGQRRPVTWADAAHVWDLAEQFRAELADQGAAAH